ncbi:unnamed protein product [Prorocentrum cordatum]|uniref:Uncharacterized protein n=1 Tax=Prorocentrum cordatum TaxID=2364126 RepID=A0ABN9QTG0_9DINO|nr:unnamed protein product [Polarella glacialis]
MIIRPAAVPSLFLSAPAWLEATRAHRVLRHVMGCSSSVNDAELRPRGGAAASPHMVRAAPLPTLLQSGLHPEPADADAFDTASRTSSRPTTLSAIQTPSTVHSNLDSRTGSQVQSSNRAEIDGCSTREIESNLGSGVGVVENRLDSRVYLEELEASVLEMMQKPESGGRPCI